MRLFSFTFTIFPPFRFHHFLHKKYPSRISFYNSSSVRPFIMIYVFLYTHIFYETLSIFKTAREVENVMVIQDVSNFPLRRNVPQERKETRSSNESEIIKYNEKQEGRPSMWNTKNV